MAHYGSPTAKRHYLFANSCVVSKLDRGRLVGWKKVDKEKRTAEHYLDRSGQPRYKGTAQLKQTQILVRDWFPLLHVSEVVPAYAQNNSATVLG